ncbi:MAG: GNAT family N-acetyltransferase [Rhodobacteraceae bacterium]|nr:GNAT family N-acetyltransferase [Paracoccaceae bacterium]
MTEPLIRPVTPDDRAAWDRLYQGYARFYKVEQSDDMRDRVWTWLHDGAHETQGLVAEGAGGTLIGLTHFRPFARPLSASTGCFLDDLFVAPEARGSGAADALIDGVRKIALENGWSVVRWITAENNYRGRGLYDRVATQTNWVTYDIKP